MTHVQKGARYTLKNLLGKTREENDLRMKVLRYVMAVGFVLSPWLGGEAYAAGIERIDNITLPNSDVKQAYFTGNDGNIAHIYAEQAHGDVGLNRFQKFEVGANQIANLYFKTSATDTNHLNTLVNTVENQISISGTVNAIRNNTIGGNLYFLSPQGMVVGSSGVINAGALTVLANNQTFTTAKDAYEVVHDSEGDEWYNPVVQSSIEIYGRINTATGINLEAQTIQIAKVSGSKTATSLLTGVVFQKLVNIDSYEALPIANNRLIAYKDEKTNKIIVAAPSNLENATEDELLQGDGRIRVYARKDIPGEGLHGTVTFTEGVVNAIGDVAIESGMAIEIDKPTSGTTPSSTASTTSITSGNQIKLLAETSDIYNAGTIIGTSTIDASAGYDKSESNYANIINYGTIRSTNGGMSLAADRLLTNNGTIEANGQIVFTVGGTLTNQGKIESTSSNVQAHIGRNFKNLGDANSESSQKGLIQAGGNVQVDYELNTKTTGIGVATPEEGEKSTIDGIYNSGFIKANGDEDPTSTGGVVDVGSGSGNIWLTSSYNIENTATGQMIAGRQITLNARDFLDNYGLIQGVTYLDIKSIMGYVYNHGTDNNGNAMDTPGRIISTGGNIALSSGQANLQIDKDEDGKKKEEYRKFTPIIIEGKVEATSDDDESNQTRKGNIEITAFLGDIYINGGTIETKPELGTNDEVKAVAGDVILDAAQNITIGFKTEKAWADDPTTDNKYGDHPEYDSKTERGYYKPLKDTSGNLVSGNAANISGTNIILTSGSGNTISMSTVNNTLTASKAITIDTASMNIVGGTFNAGTLEAKLAANGALNIIGGTINAANVNSNRNMIINGGSINTGTAQGSLSANNISMESGSVSGKDVTIAADEQVELKGGSITAEAEGAGQLTVTAGTNLVHDGTTIKADNAAFSAGNLINLQSGSLNAKGAAAFEVTNGTAGENSIAESAGDYSLSAGSLSLSANQGNIILNGTNNFLQGVTLANVGGNVEIVNGNDTKALTIATAEGTTVSGTINVTNKGEGITVEGINATGDVSLGTDEDISIAGDVNAAAASFKAGQDFVQNGGAITASGAVVTAGRDVKLNSGSMEASTSASLTAGSATSVEAGHGYISEGTEYALIAPQVTASAVKAITLDSSANQLVNVDITKVGGDLAIGSGNKNSTDALQVNIGQVVSGNLTINNYSLEGDNSANDIVVAGTLGANRITITNAEADINAGTDAVISADSISLQANSGAVNVTGDATITATNNGSFKANAKNINMSGGLLTADTVMLTAANAINQTAGSIVATTTVAKAGTDLSLASTTNKLQNVTVGTTTGNATVVSGNALKVQTDGTVGGNLSIESTSDIVSEDTISANGDVTMTAGDKVTINSGTINANSVTAKDTDLFVNGGAINVGTLAASKGLNIASNSSNTTNITANNITAGGSIGITGGNVVTTSVAADEALNITGGTVSSDGAVSLSGAKGVTIGSQADITTGNNLTIASSGGAVENNRILNITTGSVTLDGNGGVTNNVNITAAQDIILQSTTGAITNFGILSGGQDVAISSTSGKIDNQGKIIAGQDLSMSSTSGAIENSAAIEATNGIVELSGSGITNNSAINAAGYVVLSATNSIANNAGITAGQGIEMTSTAGTISNGAGLTAKGGSVALKGNKDITNDGRIQANRNVSIISEDGKVTNNARLAAGVDFGATVQAVALFRVRSLVEDSGSVTISGKGDVVNTGNGIISATQNVSMSSTTGNVENSGTIAADQSVGMTADAGTVKNSNTVNAGTGTVTMSGSGGVTNDADISAKDSVSMTSSAGAVDNSNAITVSNGSVTMTGQTSVNNEGELKATGGSVTMSGEGGVTNNADITANKNVNISADAGAITNSGSVTANTGNIDLSSQDGITSKDGDASLKTESLNGSISATTTYGEVNISEIVAGSTASASSQNGSVIIGSVSGNDVVLSSGASSSGGGSEGSGEVTNPSITVVDQATVGNSLKLQGDNITVSSVVPSGDPETNKLTVDVNGADGAGSAVQGSLNLNITGDVVFDNLNVTNANVTASGNIDVNKLGVDDKGQAQLTSNKNPENENGTTVTVVGKDAAPDAGSGNVIVAPGNDSDTWLNIKMDEEGSKTTVVDDAGRDVNNKDYPAQMSAKLVDYDPYDTYLEHYADMADIFSRSYLIDTPERTSSDILAPAQGGRVVLKQDANGLHLEIVEEQSEQEA